ncbi:hypothetical protein WME91_51670 [Sorangium sp. So ce269]
MSWLPISSVVFPSSTEPSRLVSSFRERLRQTSWAAPATDTLWVPVESPAGAVQRLERQIVALYRAHVKVLSAALSEPLPSDPELGHLARSLRAVRAFYRGWPLLQDNERTHPDAPLPVAPESFLYGRPDVVMGAEGPRVVETNFDTAVAGYEKPDAVWSICAELFELEGQLLRRGRPLAGLRDYFDELAGGQPRLIHWVRTLAAAPECGPVLTFLNDNGRGIQHIAHYAGEPSPAFPASVPGYLHRACSLYTVNRFREQFTRTLRPLVPALRGCTVPLSLTALQSKLFLAWLSDPRTRPPTLTPDERDAVDALIPETRLLAQLRGAALDRVKRHRGDFILKRTDSHMGKHVVFGCNLGQGEWEGLLRELPDQPAEPGDAPPIWLVQERVRPREYTLLEYTEEGPVERRTGLSCSPYLFGGRLRGFETWSLPFTPDHQMLKDAHFIGHFIR